MRPKHEGPPTGNVGFCFVSFRAVRDVSCVRRRARDRSIARALLGGADPGDDRSVAKANPGFFHPLRDHGVVFT